MSKITVSAILTVLRLVITLVSKCSRLVYSIIDLVDDGCLNASVPRPEWFSSLTSVIDTLESLGSHLVGVENQIDG